MPIEVIVPPLGEVGEQVTIARWHKRPGEAVEAGEPLFDVETAKATLTVEAAESGRLQKIAVLEGGQVEVGAVIAWLMPDGEPGAQPAQGPAVAAAQVTVASLDRIIENREDTSAGGREPPAGQPARTRAYASPKARRIARDRGVSLGDIAGSGPGGLIVLADLDAAPRGAGDTLREVVARRMTAAKATIPHFYLMAEVDMSELEELRSYCASLPGWDSPPTYSALMVRALGLALAALRSHNLVMREGVPVQHQSMDVGLAVAAPGGLIAPVVRDVASKLLSQVAEEVRTLTEGARVGRLRAGDLGSHAVTLSNLGMHGVDAFIGIIDPPGTMLVAAGRVSERVVARGGRIVIRPMGTLALSFDHRAFDGASAATFVARLRELLENPSELMGNRP